VAGLIPAKPGPKRPTKLTAAVVARIRELDADGQTLTAIAATVGVDVATVRVALGWELADPAAAAAAPTTIDQLRQTVERVDGVRFGALLDALQPDAGRQQGALDDILHTARTMPTDQATGLDRHLDQWEPVLAAILAAH
jgi:hypothetical protein